jgi:hypothetical protein
MLFAAEMGWGKIGIYLYVAQAVAGAAIGFAIPLLQLIAEWHGGL